MCGWQFVHMNFSKKGEQILMNLRWFTVKPKCLENNFPKITRTSQSEVWRHVILFFLLCASCHLHILDNQNFCIDKFRISWNNLSVVGANTVLFPESSSTQDTVCLSLSSSIHTLSTHTTPPKGKEHSHPVLVMVSQLGRKKKLFNQSQS